MLRSREEELITVPSEIVLSSFPPLSESPTLFQAKLTSESDESTLCIGHTATDRD
jgi:hypothetical protein